ncbi:hypothetical protein [Methyloraptor flagellatus]|jgi:hypothetical protein|uniref:Avirulence protein n=1 Tax=Methyloraptor flagellatus TaxID=3162530 RepID=A0AAU7XFD0_9HYPH
MRTPMDVGRKIQGYSLDHMVGDMHGLKSSKHIQHDGIRDLHVSGRFGALKTALTKLFSSPKRETLEDAMLGRKPDSAYNRMSDRQKAGSKVLVDALKRDFPDVARRVIRTMREQDIDMKALKVSDARHMLALANDFRSGG